MSNVCLYRVAASTADGICPADDYLGYSESDFLSYEDFRSRLACLDDDEVIFCNVTRDQLFELCSEYHNELPEMPEKDD